MDGERKASRHEGWLSTQPEVQCDTADLNRLLFAQPFYFASLVLLKVQW